MSGKITWRYVVTKNVPCLSCYSWKTDKKNDMRSLNILVSLIYVTCYTINSQQQESFCHFCHAHKFWCIFQKIVCSNIAWVAAMMVSSYICDIFSLVRALSVNFLNVPAALNLLPTIKFIILFSKEKKILIVENVKAELFRFLENRQKWYYFMIIWYTQFFSDNFQLLPIPEVLKLFW